MGYVVEDGRYCITVRRREDVDESLPEAEVEESKRLPEILKWIATPTIPASWPLGTGIRNVGGYPFNLDLLPEIHR